MARAIHTRAFAALAFAAVALSADTAETDDTPAYEPPKTLEGAHFFEPFLSKYGAFEPSKDPAFEGEWAHETHKHDGLVGDMGLVVSSPAKKHAVSTLFAAPFDPKASGGLVVQYELQLKNRLQCGGAYIKLLSASEELSQDGFKAETPYTIMFGPDNCGTTNKVHFILRHRNPLSGEWEEKHLVGPPSPEVGDGATHLYTAIVGTDNTVKLLVDNKQVKTASLLSKTDFKPAVNPEKVIDDAADSKPEEWVDEPKMDDPEAKKPDDWDEDAPPRIVDPAEEKPAAWLDDAPLKVPDPKATPPGDWDVDEDGEWEAPMVDNPDCSGAGKGCGEWQAKQIANPDYKGKWHAAKVDNPAYLGVWKPRQVDNPHYFEDETPYAMAPIGGIGIELWTMQNGILFDNIVLTGSPEVAASIAASAFEPRAAAERASKQEAAQKDGGVMAKAKLYVGKAFNWCLENAMLVGATLCLGVLPLLLFCCIGGTKKAPAAAAAGPSSSSSAGGEKKAAASSEPGPSSASAADAAEDTPEKAAGKKAGGGKKRTPKTE